MSEQESGGPGVATAVLGVARKFPAIVCALLRDGAVLGGAALVAYGAWMVYPAAGVIVGGLELAGIGLAAAARAARG